MAVKNEQIEKNLVKLTFEVSAEDFDKAINQVYKKNVKKFNVPGYRKGKAPRKIIEKYYTEAVFYDEAINSVLPQAYDEALKESCVESVARPEIDVEEIKKGEPVVFTALVTTKPEVKLGDYKGIEVEKIDHTVTDEDVDKDIEATQKKNARLITVDDRAIENGDIAVIDFEGFVDGVAFDGGKAENYNLTIGSGNFIPGFEEQIIGHSTDEEFSINVKFPEEYQAEELAGKDAEFKIKLHEIKAKELPEVDDEFVKDVSEKETVAEYRDELKETIAARLEDEAEKDKDNQIAEKLIELLEGEIPQAMYDNQVNEMVRDFEMRIRSQGIDMNTYLQYMGIDLDGLKKMYADEAKKRVQLRLALETIAKKENIEVTDADLDEAYNKMAETYKVDVETVKGAVPAETLTLDVKAEKALNMVKDSVVIK
mgnify:CR=1 FL=1